MDIGLLNLSDIIYILGIIKRVRKKDNIKPKIIVQAKGPQKTTLSPPRKIFGSKWVNNDSKLMLKPTARGHGIAGVALGCRHGGER